MKRLGTYQLVLLLLFCGVYLGSAKRKKAGTKRPLKATSMDITNCTNEYIEVERKINMVKKNIDRNNEDELKTMMDDLVNLLKKCKKFDKKIVGTIPKPTVNNAKKTSNAITLVQKTMKTFMKFMNKAKTTASKVNKGVEQDITKCITDLTFSYTYYGFTEQGTLLSKRTKGCVFLVQSTSGLNEQIKKDLDNALNQVKRKWVKQRKNVEILLEKVIVPKANYTPDSPPKGQTSAGGRSGQALCLAKQNENGTYTCVCDETTGFKLVGNAWERECQPTPVGYWLLNKLREGLNFAGSKIFGSAEIKNVNFGEGVTGKASDAMKLLNASASLKIESVDGIALSSFTWMIYVKPLAGNGGVSILKHKIGSTEITVYLVNNKIVASIQVRGAKYEVESEEIPKEEWAFVVLSLNKKAKRMRLLVFKEDDEESTLREKDIKDPMDGEKEQNIVIGGKINDSSFTGLCVACLKFYIVDLTIDEVKGARQACRKDILLASWPLNTKYSIKDMSGNDKQLLATARLKPFLQGPQYHNKGSIKLGREGQRLRTSYKVEIGDKVTWSGSFYIDQRKDKFKYAIIDFSTNNTWGFRVWVDFDSNGNNVGNLVASVAEPMPENTIKAVFDVIKMRVWYHCAFSYDGKTGFSALYLNGKRIEYQTFKIKRTGIDAVAHIGMSRRRNLDIMRGRVTCFELYEAVLNNAEVNQIYNKCFEGSTTIDNATCSIQTVRPVFTRGVGETAGTKAKPHSWPWMVQIRHRHQWQCGGTLYKPDIVITAAHCFDEKATSPEQFIVVIGSHHRVNLLDAISVTHVTNHPEYKKVGNVPLNHDIAIIKLAKCVEYNTKIQPICLTKYKVLAEKDNRVECVALGWGSTGIDGELSDELKQLRLPTIPFDECTKTLSDVDGTSSFCAGYLGAKKPDTCGGDSGGPLMCNFGSDPMYMLTGVTSWGKNACGSKNSAGVYTSIYKHRQWIEEVSKALSDCGPSDDDCKQNDFNNQTEGVLRRFDVLSETIRGISTNIASLSESNAEIGRSIGRIAFTITGNDLGNRCSTGECCADNSKCSGNICVCMTGFTNVDSVCRSVNG